MLLLRDAAVVEAAQNGLAPSEDGNRSIGRGDSRASIRIVTRAGKAVEAVARRGTSVLHAGAGSYAGSGVEGFERRAAGVRRRKRRRRRRHLDAPRITEAVVVTARSVEEPYECDPGSVGSGEVINKAGAFNANAED